MVAKASTEIGEIWIGDLDIPVRSFNLLLKAELRTVGEIKNKTDQEILAVKGFGPKSLRPIREAIAKLEKLSQSLQVTDVKGS